MTRMPKIQSPRLRAAHRRTAVSYFISAGIAAAIAWSMASPVLATDASAAPTPAPQQTAARKASDNEPMTGTHIHRDDPTNLDVVVVLGGAVRGPGEASWDDNDASVPALPMTREQDSGKR